MGTARIATMDFWSGLHYRYWRRSIRSCHRINLKPSSDSSLIFAGPILRYNLKLSDKWNLNLGGQFTGNRWHTKSNYGGSIEKRDFRFRSYRLFGNLEYNINERHSVYAGGGIDFGEKSNWRLQRLAMKEMWRMAV